MDQLNKLCMYLVQCDKLAPEPRVIDGQSRQEVCRKVARLVDQVDDSWCVLRLRVGGIAYVVNRKMSGFQVLRDNPDLELLVLEALAGMAYSKELSHFHDMWQTRVQGSRWCVWRLEQHHWRAAPYNGVCNTNYKNAEEALTNEISIWLKKKTWNL